MASVGGSDGPGGSGSLWQVPAGGTVGQVLTKNSSTEGDLGWATPTAAPAVQTSPARSGLWYDNRVRAHGAAAVGSVTIAAGTCWYIPYYFGVATSIGSLGVISTAAPNASVFYGISTSVNGLPGSVLAPFNAVMSVAGTTTVTIPTTAVSPGWHYLSIGLAATATTSMVLSGSSAQCFRSGVIGSNVLGVNPTYFQAASESPQAFPTVTATFAATLPVIFYRIA